MESHKLGINVLTLFYVDAFNWNTFVNQDILQFNFFSSNIACHFSIGTIIKTKLPENDIAKLLEKLILLQLRYITSNKFIYGLRHYVSANYLITVFNLSKSKLPVYRKKKNEYLIKRKQSISFWVKLRFCSRMKIKHPSESEYDISEE